MSRTSITLVAIALTAALCGCAATTDVPYARTFPAHLPIEEGTVNIQVIQGEQTLRFTNTSATDFGPFDLWINKWYVRPFNGLAIGETRTIPLREFRDEFSQPIRAGGFFATEAPEALVSAHIEQDGSLRRLIVIPRRVR
ncbi:MAG: hypothetical protein EA379_07845 [Phycisphaerales bacterium]|nr:MAG: hypothetical protein EA379_07845 [Phycisphaerales bacterium]